MPYDHSRAGRDLAGLWNEGHRYYLSGGTDVHDVWNHESGRIRTFAHVAGPLDASLLRPGREELGTRTSATDR